jgi:hypothetical protein
LFSARHSAAALSALLLSAAAFLLSGEDARAEDQPAACDEAGLAVLATPIAPWKGAPLRVVFAAEEALKGELSLIAPD